ncbi:serine/threonine-protein kinase [Streptomyces longwoodensis]|uniref:serine/threonine-protein kinase n=1 Tax=Streptomyces longwoodensis TaxID=68231 RepID=UPI0033E7BA64
MNLPDRVGPYRPTRLLGTGGMGTVYLAPDPRGGPPLAVKVLHRDFAADPAHRARFRRETALLRRVTGPYLVPLVDADPDADLPWLATAYVQGNTVQQHVRDAGPLRADNLLTFAAAVAHALACIHGAGVAHRDLKPTNVLLAADGPRVVDFGIAHHLDATAITATSVTTGTPGWMAPEQLTDGTTLPAGDIFAWGLLVAYAAAAAHPFGAPTGITHRIVSAAPSLLGVPDTLLPLVRDALHKEPGQRPSAADVAERTAALYGPTGTAVFPTLSYTRCLEREDAQPGRTVPLEPARWDVPVPADPPVEAAPAETPAAAAEAESGAVQPPPRRAPAHPTPDAPPAATSGRPAPPPTPPTPPTTPPAPTAGAPTRLAPPPRATAAAPPAPAPRRKRRRAGVHVLASAVIVGAAAGGIAAGLSGGGKPDTGAGRQPTTGPTAPSTPTSAPAHPAAATPSAAEPSGTAEAVAAEQQPEPVDVFGGLRIAVPADFPLVAQPGTDGTDPAYGWDTTSDSDTGTDTDGAAQPPSTSVDFASTDGSGGGLRIVWSPALTVDGIREGQSESGALWSVDSEDGSGSSDESVVSVKEKPLADIGGKKARSWAVGTDVLPDYDGSRKNSHRVWWLPHSKYLLYTYGDPAPAVDKAVDQLIDGITFRATGMPRDCADAVVALDEAARSGDLADDHGALGNCRAAAVDGAEQLDPGTVRTRTEAACVALAEAYNGYGAVLSYAPEAYEELRPACDIPGAVAHPRPGSV